MGQVVKLCNNLIYAAQMTATAEATALAVKLRRRHGQAARGPDARHRRLRGGADPAARARGGARQPGLQRLAPGFMTDLMAKDLDLALAYAAGAGVPMAPPPPPAKLLTAATTAGYGREDFSALAKVVLARPARHDGRHGPLPTPALILAADHRARGVMTTEN